MKLYKTINNKIHFWETWDINEKKGATNIGIVGEIGRLQRN